MAPSAVLNVLITKSLMCRYGRFNKMMVGDLRFFVIVDTIEFNSKLSVGNAIQSCYIAHNKICSQQS